MDLYALIFLAFVPPVICFVLFSLFVRGQKIRYCAWSCVVGLVTVIPTAFVQYFVLRKIPVFVSSTVMSLLVTAVIFNGLIEESLKMIFMLLLPQKKLTEAAFFTCALLCGLTLGCFESLIYMTNRMQGVFSGADRAVFELLLKRMFTAVFIHTFCAGLSGLYIWTFKRKASRVQPFVYAVLLHGVYNFFAGFESFFYWFSIVAILFAALECRIWYKNIILLRI